jgi:hypothetical protein
MGGNIISPILLPNHSMKYVQPSLVRKQTLLRPSFQFNAKTAFLTYAQAPISWTKETLLESLQLSVAPDAYCISKESHEDGGVHYHVFLQWFEAPFRSRDCRVFDVDGTHANVQSPRDPKACYDYVKKDGKTLESDIIFITHCDK